jgi:hypothetical protein
MSQTIETQDETIRSLLSAFVADDHPTVNQLLELTKDGYQSPEYQEIVSAILSLKKKHARFDRTDLECILPHLSPLLDDIQGDGPTRGNSPPQDLAPGTLGLDPSLLSLLSEERKTLEIFPAQEHEAGVFSYAVRIQGKPYILTSRKELIPFDEIPRRGWRLKTQNTSTFGLRSKGIRKYLDGYRANPLEIFEKIRTCMKRHIVLRDANAYTVLALYIMATYVFRVFRYFPYLHILGEKGSAKTVLMDIMAPLAFNGRVAVDITASALFHDINANGSTLFLDEVDHLKKDSPLSRILKSGFCKSGAVERVENHALKVYSTYSPKVLAGIEELDHVLRDRTIRNLIVRCLPSEEVEQYVEDDLTLAFQEDLKDELYNFGLINGPLLANNLLKIAEEITRHGLRGRAVDLWTPLLSVSFLVDLSHEGETLSISEEVYHFYEDLQSERQRGDQIENDYLKTLIVLKRFIDEGATKPLEGDIIEVPTEEVFRYFKMQEEFYGLRSKTWLTQHLGKVGVTWPNRKIGGVTQRVYLISIPKFMDFYCRYVSPEGKA